MKKLTLWEVIKIVVEKFCKNKFNIFLSFIFVGLVQTNKLKTFLQYILGKPTCSPILILDSSTLICVVVLSCYTKTTCTKFVNVIIS